MSTVIDVMHWGIIFFGFLFLVEMIWHHIAISLGK